MVYTNNFCGNKISALGFGTMRLPLIPGGKGADIDQDHVNKMVDIAIGNGVNYFDTAYVYHDMMSEVAIGKALSRYDRSQYFIADKFPGHQIMSEYNVEAIFEDQLQKCQVEYFDYYLLHNVNNATVSTYTSPEYDIINRVYEYKKQGKIRHLGFSFHGDIECLKQILDAMGDKAEFCQIQLNYLDWTLQDAKSKYELLKQRNIPIVVMEPLRGGKLTTVKLTEKLMKRREHETAAGWGFRYLQSMDAVKVVLSGMSNITQMEENCETFSRFEPANEEEKKELYAIADALKTSVPCTACRYCCDGCPKKIDIPRLIAMYNDFRFSPSMNIAISLLGIPEGMRPEDCIGCGQCSSICPQGIDVPGLMIKMKDAFDTLPSWEKISEEREKSFKKCKA